jgi:hypothetical protein
MTDRRPPLRTIGGPVPITAARGAASRAHAADPGTPAVRVHRIYNAEQWNHIVHRLPRSDVRQGFEWGEAWSEDDRRPVRLAVFRGPDPVAAAAVLSRTVPGFGALLYAPRGPLFRPDVPEGVTRLIEELRLVGQRAGAAFVRLSPAIPTGDAGPLAPLEGHGLVPLDDPWTTWNTPRGAAVLDITRHEDEIWCGLRRRFRHEVAAAPRHGIVVEPSERDEDLCAVRDLGVHRAVVRHYRAARTVTVLIARAADVVLGFLLAVRFGRCSTVLASSIYATASVSMPRYVAPALGWELIRRERADGVELIDFGATRPPRPSDSGGGLDHFTAGLGCRLETFVRLHDLVLRPLRYRVFRAYEARVLPWLGAAAVRTRRSWPGRLVGRPA